MPNFAYDLPEDYYFGGGASESFAPPLAVAALIVAVILMMVLPRKYAIIPFLLGSLLVPLNVTLVVSSLHFNANRILLLAGLARLLVRRSERFPGDLNGLDKVFLYGALLSSITYILIWRQVGAVINRAGFLFSTFGAYMLLRSWIRSKEDVVRVIKVLACVVVLVAPLMWHEHNTLRNSFSFLGSPEFAGIRNNRVRASGPFAHPIIAGTFGVVLVPLFIGLWWFKPRSWFIAIVGVASSIVMMFASSSSTPVMAFPAGILALSMWPLRKKMRKVRWGIVMMLVGLQLAMKSAIWFLPSRMGGLLGGSGWHRSMLMDNFIHHFFDWFLIGTRDNANWGWSMWDVDNAYVGAGLGGGLLGFILFVTIFVRAYRMIGVARAAAEETPRDARLIWAIGAALFANTIAFFGIVYFDQSMMAWYALLAMISVVAAVPVESYNGRTETVTTGMPAPVAAD